MSIEPELINLRYNLGIIKPKKPNNSISKPMRANLWTWTMVEGQVLVRLEIESTRVLVRCVILIDDTEGVPNRWPPYNWSKNKHSTAHVRSIAEKNATVRSKAAFLNIFF